MLGCSKQKSFPYPLVQGLIEAFLSKICVKIYEIFLAKIQSFKLKDQNVDLSKFSEQSLTGSSVFEIKKSPWTVDLKIHEKRYIIDNEAAKLW